MDNEFSFSSMVGKFVLATILLGAVAVGWSKLKAKRRALASLDWPWTEVKIEDSLVQRNEDSEGDATWMLKLSFFYHSQHDLKWFRGVYSETWSSEAEAETQQRCLRERPLFARYNPSKPGEYFIDPYRDVFKGESVQAERILKY